jgi:hypothetical protein
VNQQPRLPSLRALTRELRALHSAWSHPDAGGEYVKLVCQVGDGWRVAAATQIDDLWIAYADTLDERSLMAFGWEFIPGSTERECAHCKALGCPLRFDCLICNGSGRVHAPSPFDATAAARRLLAAARDGGCPMNETEALAALKAIGLRGDVQETGSPDWRRIFMIDEKGVSHGRLSLYRGELTNVKFYVSAVSDGPQILPDERLPFAWRMWIERGELLTLRDWAQALGRAREMACEERDQKQAWRDANPKPKPRKKLQLNVRSHLNRILFFSETK